MKMTTDNALRDATRGLTGNRIKDIAFLKEQIASGNFDEQVTAALSRILGGLSFSESSAAAA